MNSKVDVLKNKIFQKIKKVFFGEPKIDLIRGFVSHVKNKDAEHIDLLLEARPRPCETMSNREAACFLQGAGENIKALKVIYSAVKCVFGVKRQKKFAFFFAP